MKCIAVVVLSVLVLATTAKNLALAEQETLDSKQSASTTTASDLADGLSIIEPINIIPVRPRPKNPETCCHPGTTYVDLNNGDVCDFYNNAVTVVSGPTPSTSPNKCSMQTVLKINFEKITTSPCDLVDGCLYGPYCGRRMLRIDLELSAQNRSGFLFNVGDSVSNDGYGGDGSDQDNDAEIQGQHPDVAVYSSDLCNSDPTLNRLAFASSAIQQGLVSRMTIYVSDKHVRVTNDNGLDETLCHKCLFALNGQADPAPGGPNQDIYLALNRVVSLTSSRTGFGVCSARLSWMCPW